MIAQQRLARVAGLVQQGEALPQAAVLMNAADDIKCDSRSSASFRSSALLEPHVPRRQISDRFK